MSGQSRRLEARRRRQRRVVVGAIVAGLLLVAIVLVVFAPGGPGDQVDETSVGRVSMTEMAFSPDPIDLPRRDARLVIVNDGRVPHSFVIPELGKGTPDLAAGEAMELDLTAQPAGTYTVLCDIPGHREAGMETTITLR